MFYVKKPITDNMEFQMEITEKNVFCRCPVCGKEVSVNLEEVLGKGKGNLLSTSVLCEECSRELMEVDDGVGPKTEY